MLLPEIVIWFCKPICIVINVSFVCSSKDTIEAGTSEEYGNYPIEFLNAQEFSGLPAHKLKVCPGAVVILMRNINSPLGLCNGIRAVVVKCLDRLLDLLILTGKCAGQRHYLPRVPMTSDSDALPFRLSRRQFPVKLAWAMSINKAQGQSLIRVGVLLPQPVFAHGQLYVALSRGTSYANVRVWVQDCDKHGYYDGESAEERGVYTDNVVYTDILVDVAVHSDKEGSEMVGSSSQEAATVRQNMTSSCAAIELADDEEQVQGSVVLNDSQTDFAFPKMKDGDVEGDSCLMQSNGIHIPIVGNLAAMNGVHKEIRKRF